MQRGGLDVTLLFVDMTSTTANQGEAMNTIMRTAAVMALMAMATEATGIASVGARKADYVGGTVPALAAAAAATRINGSFETSDARALVFNGARPEAAFRIPYASITDIEYGQKAGRRIGPTIGITAIAGPVGLLTLLSKKREHFLTIEFRADDGTTQVAVFEIGKDIVKPMLIVLETRTNKKTVFQEPCAACRARPEASLSNRFANLRLHVGRHLCGPGRQLFRTALAFAIDVLDQQFHLGNLADL